MATARKKPRGRPRKPRQWQAGDRPISRDGRQYVVLSSGEWRRVYADA